MRKMTLSLNVYFSSFFILIFCKVQSQDIKSNTGFGQGIVTINWYTFPPNTANFPGPIEILRFQKFYDCRYFIKGNKILRKDEPDSSLPGIVQPNTINTRLMHPSYLIDWAKQHVYTFSTGNGSNEISQQRLEDDSSEVFYRHVSDNKTIITSLEDNNSISIANKQCFKGNARNENGDNLIFYYCKDSLKVRSPLNGWLPHDFSFNVMRICLPTDWTKEDGKPGIGTIIFQVTDIKECGLSDSLFQISR